jgi:hypothetical protein
VIMGIPLSGNKKARWLAALAGEKVQGTDVRARPASASVDGGGRSPRCHNRAAFLALADGMKP